MGYAGGRRTAFDMRDKAIKMLKDIEASREQLTEALSLFNPAVEQSIYVDVSNAIFRNLKRDPSKLSDYVNDFNRTFPENNINITSSNAWEAFARKYVAWNQELEDNFQDLAFFQSSKALRRPDIFYAGPYAVE